MNSASTLTLSVKPTPSNSPDMTHTSEMFGKKISYTEKSIFRVEVSRNAKATYEGMYGNSNPISAIKWFNNTVAKEGQRVRLVKDGDEFIIISKKKG